MRALRRLPGFAIDLILLPALVLLAAGSRLRRRPVDVGLGPEPFISNVHHRKALEARGYRAETFVDHVYYITDEFDLVLRWPGPLRYLARHALFAVVLFRYRALFLHFTGGPLGRTTLLGPVEPWLLALAGIRCVVMPYGGDVQDLTRTPNLAFKQAMAVDYPGQRRLRRRIVRRIDLWTAAADHVIAGCDWVDYLHSWDTLTLVHWPIDTDQWRPPAGESGRAATGRPLRIVHAPNHRAVKGTAHLERAVEGLRREGLALELVVVERRPNAEVRAVLESADIVVDQLVIGWYAMFAMEAMALGKPVLCHLRADLLRLYEDAGLLEVGEIPIVSCDARSVSGALRTLALDPALRQRVGAASRAFVERRHSLDVVGGLMASILERLGIEPQRR